MIPSNEMPYLRSLGFNADKNTGMVMCAYCGNTYDDSDKAERHWYEEHNPF